MGPFTVSKQIFGVFLSHTLPSIGMPSAVLFRGANLSQLPLPP
jgi:hypothetical protein